MSPGVAAVLFVVVGLTNVALGVPLARGRVGPNRIYGFRTRKTFSSEAIWYRANRVLDIDLVVAGGVIVVGAMALALAQACLVPTLRSDAWTFGLVVVTMAAALAHSVRALARM